MRIDDFYEMAIIKMERQKKTWKYLGDLIGTSSIYAKQVVQGHQNGPKAKEYRQRIAEDLEIVLSESISDR